MEFGFFYESLLEWVRSIYITYIIRKCPRIFLDLNVILLNLTIIPGCTWIQPIHINACIKKKKTKKVELYPVNCEEKHYRFRQYFNHLILPSLHLTIVLKVRVCILSGGSLVIYFLKCTVKKLFHPWKLKKLTFD